MVDGFCKLTGKRGYGSRSDASRAKAAIHYRGGFGKLQKRSSSVYRCRACGMWHLGREKT